MRNMTLRFGTAALIGSLGILGCEGDARHDARGVRRDESRQLGEPAHRGAVLSARIGDGPLLRGISASSAVSSKPGIVSWKQNAIFAKPQQPQNEEGGTGGVGGAGGSTSTVPANDTCTGEVVTLGVDYHVQPHGTLIDAADDVTTWCADASTDPGNPDVVYQLEVLEDVTLNLSIVATGFNPALSVRLTSCGEELAGDTCMDLPGATTSEHLLLSLTTGTYWLVIDSADGATGEFDLDFTTTAPRCGDGVIDANEECDPGDGATNPDDGCWDSGAQDECKYGKPEQDTGRIGCNGYSFPAPGMSSDPEVPEITRQGPFHNGSGGHVQQNDTTVDLAVCGWPAVGPENVFEVTPTDDGVLHARIGLDDTGFNACSTEGWCGDFILYARKDQCQPIDPVDATQQLACADFNVDPAHWEELEISFPVTADTPYWVFVDGLDNKYGVSYYFLEMWLMPVP